MIKEITEVAFLDIFEIGIPFADLKAKKEDEIHLFISISKDNEEMERCPWRGHLNITVPTPDFEALMWYLEITKHYRHESRYSESLRCKGGSRRLSRGQYQ